MKKLTQPIPVVDLKAQYNSIKKEIHDAVEQVLDHGQFILGPEVTAFEHNMADYCGVKYAVSVASGTDALRLALLACGIEAGDEVITTPFTFVATAETIIQCGATPVFADISPRSFNIDPGKIEEKITGRTKAILPVHLYGQSADMGPIMEIARKYKLRVIEDCAQALGTEYKGKKVGSIGDAGCLSFFPSKNLGAYGDAGMVVTGNSEIADITGLLRKHGARVTYYYDLIGFNSRLDTIQAAILNVKLKRLDEWINLRCERAALYNRLLSEVDGIQAPLPVEYGKPSYNYYTIRLNNPDMKRDDLKKYLDSIGIKTMVYYPLSLHLQKAYLYLGGKKGEYPESERAQEQVISLPMYPELREDQVQEVVEGIKGFLKTA